MNTAPLYNEGEQRPFYNWSEPYDKTLPFITDPDAPGCKYNDSIDEKECASDSIHILVVDDDESFGRMLVDVIIRLTGYDCSYAENARSALKILEESVVDVVITDIKMPDISGLWLTRIIKEKYHADIIVITGYYENFTYEESIENGANDFLEKPVKPTELIIRLKRVLRERANLSKCRQAEDNLLKINLELEKKIQERNEELLKANMLLHNRISALEQVENELKKQARQLAQANKELESFSYSVSHDLRTPLRAIEGYSLMLARDINGGLNEEAKNKIEVIRDQAHKMDRLIAALLDFSRLSGQALTKTAIDMESLAAETWSEIDRISPDRNVDMHIAPLPAGYGDYNLIRQVLTNLISNAVKFTKCRQTASLAIGGHKNSTEAIYYVKDNGVGFDMKYYDKLFGIFQRLHDEDDYEGTGVGLSIVKRIVEHHGGRVWAEGKTNEGAVFSFSLPLQREQI